MGMEGFKKPVAPVETGAEKPEREEDTFVVDPIHAQNAILMAMQWVAATGAGDSEISQLQKWLDEVRSGELSPREALENTQRLTGSRQDYH